MTYCKTCGQLLENGVRFCSVCGSAAVLNEPITKKEKKRRKETIILILCILAGTAGVSGIKQFLKDAYTFGKKPAEEQMQINADTFEEDGQEYILSESNIRYLEREDLENLTAEECRIARNEIYARHGRMFDDEALQAYFESCSWYTPQIRPEDFGETLLNEYERANKDLIAAYEREQGYR